MNAAADHDAVEVQVRYRPSADVLSAAVPTSDDAVVHRDEPDTDTVVQWVRRPDGRRMMVGAQVLFAASRARLGKLGDTLPPAFSRLIGTHLAAGDAADFDGPVAFQPVTVYLSTDDLLLADDRSQPDDPAPAGLAPLRASATVTASLCSALDQFIDALSDATPHADPDPTNRLVQTLDELAETLNEGAGLAAPGAAAAARAAVRGGVPLTANERVTLNDVLDRIDNPDQWPALTARLSDLATRLTGGGQAR